MIRYQYKVVLTVQGFYGITSPPCLAGASSLLETTNQARESIRWQYLKDKNKLDIPISSGYTFFLP